MTERPRIRSAPQYVYAIDELEPWADNKALKAAYEDLQDNGVQDFSGAEIRSWYDSVNQRMVIVMSVDASARPEDW